MSKHWPRVGETESERASYELSRLPLGERIKGVLLYAAFIGGIILVMGGIVEVFTPGEKYTSKELDAIKEEYLEEYIEKNGDPGEMYVTGRQDMINEVLDILDRYGIDDQELIDELEYAWEI